MENVGIISIWNLKPHILQGHGPFEHECILVSLRQNQTSVQKSVPLNKTHFKLLLRHDSPRPGCKIRVCENTCYNAAYGNAEKAKCKFMYLISVSGLICPNGATSVNLIFRQCNKNINKNLLTWWYLFAFHKNSTTSVWTCLGGVFISVQAFTKLNEAKEIGNFDTLVHKGNCFYKGL